jgi:hypothetical protein
VNQGTIFIRHHSSTLLVKIINFSHLSEKKNDLCTANKRLRYAKLTSRCRASRGGSGVVPVVVVVAGGVVPVVVVVATPDILKHKKFFKQYKNSN